MTISSKEIDKLIEYKAIEYNNFIMKMKDHHDLEKILIRMLEHGWNERIRRTYSRYCVLRRKFESKMIEKRKWYD